MALIFSIVSTKVIKSPNKRKVCFQQKSNIVYTIIKENFHVYYQSIQKQFYTKHTKFFLENPIHKLHIHVFNYDPYIEILSQTEKNAEAPYSTNIDATKME